MRQRYELLGNYISDFKNDNKEELKEAISEAGLHNCINCGYITGRTVAFENYDFAMKKKIFKEDAILCNDCYKELLSSDCIEEIKEE